jgi:drug/metabolite transporter (DMT)-like permease
MSVALALPSALTFGVADFAGGVASRRSPVLFVTAVAQASGLVALLLTVWFVAGAPSLAAVVLGGLAAVGGTGGLLLYLRGLAIGPMGVIAPLSAVVGAGLPLVYGIVLGERPGPLVLTGIAIALVAILLASAGSSRTTGAARGILLGLGAGLGFGLFFIALDATPAGSGLWPLLAGRVLSTVLLAILLLARPALRDVGRVGAGTLALMVLSGAFDTFANVLFLLAARAGDLGVTSVVVSLYPVVVVLLARFVLGERLTYLQLTGAGLALGASVLLAVG